MNIGEEARVRVLEQIDDEKYHVLNIKSNEIGLLNVKGRLNVKKDGNISVWVIHFDKLKGIYIYGNAYFGKYSISKGIRERYVDIINRIITSPSTVQPDDISIIKGMVNRCIKKDQWDWYTTYEYIGYPNFKLMRNFVRDCVKARKSLQNNDHNVVLEFRKKYHIILNSMLFHLGAKPNECIVDINQSISIIETNIWEKLSHDSRKNIIMLEDLSVKASIFMLMHYFVILEQEFYRHILSPFIKSNKVSKQECTHQKFQQTHDILVGKKFFSLGSIPYLGWYAGNIQACETSVAIQMFTEYLDSDIEVFKDICERINKTKVCGLSIVNIRNGLAHGNTEILNKIDSTAYQQIRSFLLLSPSEILKRIIEISHL